MENKATLAKTPKSSLDNLQEYVWSFVEFGPTFLEESC